jgi:predicted deacylase
MSDWDCDIDLDAPGKQTGRVEFRRSGEEIGGHATAAPLTRIAHGEGPTLVRTAGVHGDEYEGQVALSALARQLEPAAIRGRVIIMPTANIPACVAGQRLSPIDGLNLNRVFPGEAGGSITHRIARFIERELYRRADYAVDIHAGGAILQFLPATVVAVTEDDTENQRRVDLASAFGPRHCMLFGAKTMGLDVGIESAMLRQGVIGISGEYGGSAALGAEALSIVRAGIQDVIAFLGVGGKPSDMAAARGQPALIDLRKDDVYVMAQQPGVLERQVELGIRVEAGARLGLLHHPEQPATPPTPILAPMPGIVIAFRPLARSSAGDWLFIVGPSVETLPEAGDSEVGHASA